MAYESPAAQVLPDREAVPSAWADFRETCQRSRFGDDGQLNRLCREFCDHVG